MLKGYIVFVGSVHLSIFPSVRADTKYIPRFAFVLMSGLFRHCGVKLCFVGLKFGVVGLKKIKERSWITRHRSTSHWSFSDYRAPVTRHRACNHQALVTGQPVNGHWAPVNLPGTGHHAAFDGQ